MSNRIGILCAMSIELADLVANLENKEVVQAYGYDFYTGTMAGRDVVLVQCGVGLVNAARGTQLMIDKFEPAAIINSGIAGGIAPGLSVGDIVIASQLVQHDFDASAFGYVKGYQCTGKGGDKPTIYTADDKLAQELIEAAKIISNESASPEVPRNVHSGVIASGDQFIATTETKKQIACLFNATAAEMEGSAIAQTASYAGVPFAVLRVMSDLADGTAPASYEEFEKAAADMSAEIIMKFVELSK